MILLLIATLLFLSWFRVDGSELQSMDQVSENYTVSVRKTPGSLNNYQTIEYTLTADQIVAIKELVLDTSFTRHLSRHRYYSGLRDTYSILLELYDDQGQQLDFIQIFFVEDIYFTISAPYAEERLTLKIQDKQFDEKLDAILTGQLPWIIPNNDKKSEAFASDFSCFAITQPGRT